MAAIHINSLGPLPSSAANLLKRIARPSVASSQESPLLQRIRTSLRGHGAEPVSTVYESTFFYDESDDRELAWSGHTVVLSKGGTIIKQWSFNEESEPVQWACLGKLDQTVLKNPISQTAANYTRQDEPPPPAYTNGRPIFGPFTRANVNPSIDAGTNEIQLATFIFLRSIVKIHLVNGVDYTFSLPFVIRRAWPVSPHGVIVQRVLDPHETLEAKSTGDMALPTIFSISTPFSEAAMVGMSACILKEARDLPPSLKNEEEQNQRPLKSIPPTEMIVWMSCQGPPGDFRGAVTVDMETGTLSVWHYVHLKRKDTPSTRKKEGDPHIEHKKRQSASSINLANRRTSNMFDDARNLLNSLSSPGAGPSTGGMGSQDFTATQISEFGEVSDLPSLPNMRPALSSAATMASLMTATQNSDQSAEALMGRRSSMARGDLSMSMDRMVLGGRLESEGILDDGRMKVDFWMERLATVELEKEDAKAWKDVSVALFDDRWDGQQRRCLMAITLPASQRLLIYSLTQREDRTMKAFLVDESIAMSVASLRATRSQVWDLLVVKPTGDLALFTHGLAEIPVALREPQGFPVASHGPVTRVKTIRQGTVALTHRDGWTSRATFDIFPQDQLTTQCLQVLALILPPETAFNVHLQFLQRWSARGWSTARDIEFSCLTATLYETFGLQIPDKTPPATALALLGHSPSHNRLREDPVLRNLRRPLGPVKRPMIQHGPPHPLLAPTLFGLHILGESLRLLVHRYYDVTRIATLLCRMALIVRPEWADYWKRLVPDAISHWPSPATSAETFYEDKIPVWPVDIGAVLQSRLSNPEWNTPWHDMQHIVSRFNITPSVFFGICDPLQEVHELSLLYNTLADNDKTSTTQKRAEDAAYRMVSHGVADCLYVLPFGAALPLREAIRSCQLAPPGNWPLEAYIAIGRNDLAASAYQSQAHVKTDGYKSRQEFMDPSKPRLTISQLVNDAKSQAAGEVDTTTGVELNQKEFTDIRFGQDRRLEEVARMLCSSTVPTVKAVARPTELSEHDQAKEHQSQVMRITERTLALPYGRAMFTFGTVPVVTREAYVIPKIEYTVRIHPLNIQVTPEPGKIPQDSLNWGEFHNGVAAALRIASGAQGVKSSWIAFNKPAELSPEHAGFLLGLGLTGHLRDMLTWHTFSYLTPKHDLTSIGLLLGLAASNVGTANEHVTKLLAVHTPALLPTPNVDLNVPLLTQAAGLSGVGILYMGTRNRRMAEVCLTQISRKDLTQPDIHNEHREAHTYCSALAFGMIMLGKGTDIPADKTLVKRLHVLIHGEASSSAQSYRPKHYFDINLTSPAATMSLGLMYLRTNRRDIADILTIPETVLELNSIQPSFLLIRTIARNLIMFDQIAPSPEWVLSQIPPLIRQAADAKLKYSKQIDDAMHLAYYNIVAGCCFVMGLKYAGTTRQGAYHTIVKNYDMFSRLVYTTNLSFDHKIKRSTIRDGLNLISIALSMVMAGTGEITCLRRIRYSHGMYQQSMYHHGFKYGVHAATHMSLGLLFLGGGRYTLGSSDAAIAAMVVAFFPRFNGVSSDNKSFLQALRHLWVLAVEPRCLIARDVDTKEVVYLPVKIKTQEQGQSHVAQLVSPTLIPDLDKVASVRVDTPRYWPFYLDTLAHPRHKEALLKSQTLYVKRRTAFLSYTEDPRGSRSLFVRSGSSSANDGALLDFPKVQDTSVHPSGDMSEFITSFSNNSLFLAFADHLARPGRLYTSLCRNAEPIPEDERVFHGYCHAALLDSIMQDKPETLQAHLTLYMYRIMDPRSRYFHLRMQDLRLATEFYGGKIYDKRFSGAAENNMRPGLLKEGTVLGVLHALDSRLVQAKADESRFANWIGMYARGETLPPLTEVDDIESLLDMDIDGGHQKTPLTAEAKAMLSKYLGWYLVRHSVPSSTFLSILRELATDAHRQCIAAPPPDGTDDAEALDCGIREVLHTTGGRMASSIHGTGWTVSSLDDVIAAWKLS